jgi:hypothetical protein
MGRMLRIAQCVLRVAFYLLIAIGVLALSGLALILIGSLARRAT